MYYQAMSLTNIVMIPIDLGKNTFHVVGLVATGAIVFARSDREISLSSRWLILRPCLIGMEGCAGHSTSVGGLRN